MLLLPQRLPLQQVPGSTHHPQELQEGHRDVVRRRVQGVLLHQRALGQIHWYGRHFRSVKPQEGNELQVLWLVHEEDRVRRSWEVSSSTSQQKVGRDEERNKPILSRYFWAPPPRGGRRERLSRVRREPDVPIEHGGAVDQRRVVSEGRERRQGFSCLVRHELGQWTLDV